MNFNDLVPGSKFEIELYSDDIGEKVKPVFVSELEWVESDSIAVIAAPIYEGIVYPIHVGAHMEVCFAHKYQEFNRIDMYKFTAVVRKRKTGDNIALLEIELKSEIEKIQRRQFFRFECSVPVRYRQVVSLNREHNEEIEYKKAFSRDISGGGLCFVTDEKLEMNKILEIEVTLAEGETKNFYGTIVRVNRMDNSERSLYEIGIWFKKIENKDREAIVKFIFAEQRKLIKKGLI